MSERVSRSFAHIAHAETAPNPGLNIDGLGKIGLPLNEEAAQRLISKCQRSPFGKGNQTLVDDTVRKCWELDHNQFSLGNPAWQTFVSSVLVHIHTKLGLSCRRDRVGAEMYKLLLYEEGAFFKAHQDSEKAPGMFGTLVISLPSYHDGGQVVLTHGKKEETYDSASYGEYSTSIAAWYADVFHEVKPVTKGFRLVLTYNLIQEPGSAIMKAPANDFVEMLKESLTTYENALQLRTNRNSLSDYPDYLTYKLEQQYTKNGLALNSLKGNDFAQVAALEAACNQIGFELYLAAFQKQITIYDDSGNETNREESCDWVCRLDGSSCAFSPRHSKESELVDDGYDTEEADPDETEHQPYMGNWGADTTHWYRSTLLFIVPPSKHVEFVVGTSPYSFWKGASDMLPRLFQEAFREIHIPEQSRCYAQDQLWTLCKRAIFEAPDAKKFSLFNADIKAKEKALQNVAIACATLDWLTWFDSLSQPYKLQAECLRAIGRNMATMGVIARAATAEKVLHLDITVFHKFACLDAIRSGFTEWTNDIYTVEFESWVKIAVQHVLASDLSTSKYCGRALAGLLPLCELDIERDILPKIRQMAPMTVAGFVSRLACCDEVIPDENSENACMAEALTQLWSNFRYTGPVDGESLTKDELDVILYSTREHHMPMLDKIEAMHDVLLWTLGPELHDHLMPFVDDILAGKSSALKLTDDNEALQTAISSYIISVFAHYIVKYVKPRPPPITCSLVRRGCGCTDCRVVDTFMASPIRTELKYPCQTSTRHHLHTWFTDVDYKQYTVDTIRTTYPETYHIVKSMNAEQVQDAAWNKRLDEAQARLKKMAERDVVLMVNVLGENYNAIMTCRAENVVHLLKRKKVLESTTGNPVSGSRSNTNRKRAAEDEQQYALIRADAMKRQRMAESADVVDLTDE